MEAGAEAARPLLATIAAKDAQISDLVDALGKARTRTALLAAGGVILGFLIGAGVVTAVTVTPIPQGFSSS